MAGTRASVFEDPELDTSEFTPKPATDGVTREQVRAVAEPASFLSREAAPAPVPSRREPRRHRTGRNVQLNLKVRQEDADAFYALADEKGWVLGEAFQMAIQALKDKEIR
jgi:hypothetical protein